MLGMYLLMSIILSGFSLLFLIIAVILYTGDDEDRQDIRFISLMTVASWVWPAAVPILVGMFFRKAYLILTGKI